MVKRLGQPANQRTVRQALVPKEAAPGAEDVPGCRPQDQRDSEVPTHLGQLLVHVLFNVIAEGQLGVGDGAVVPSPLLQSDPSMSSPSEPPPVNTGVQGPCLASPQHSLGTRVPQRSKTFAVTSRTLPPEIFLLNHLFILG